MYVYIDREKTKLVAETAVVAASSPIPLYILFCDGVFKTVCVKSIDTYGVIPMTDAPCQHLHDGFSLQQCVLPSCHLFLLPCF